MEMTEAERADLANRITSARIERFVTRSAAYGEAKINSGTWSNLEEGKPVAERTLITALRMLWPETGGDWRKLDPPLGSTSDLESQVRASNLPAAAKAHILELLTRERRTA